MKGPSDLAKRIFAKSTGSGAIPDKAMEGADEAEIDLGGSAKTVAGKKLAEAIKAGDGAGVAGAFETLLGLTGGPDEAGDDGTDITMPDESEEP